MPREGSDSKGGKTKRMKKTRGEEGGRKIMKNYRKYVTPDM